MRRIAFRMPLTLQALMRESFLETYGQRGKSRWVKEAIKAMLDEDKALSWVGRGEGLVDENAAKEMISVSKDLDQEMRAAARIVRRQDPLIEGIQSKIVRGAIRRRLAGEGHRLPWPRKSTSVDDGRVETPG